MNLGWSVSEPRTSTRKTIASSSYPVTIEDVMRPLWLSCPDDDEIVSRLRQLRDAAIDAVEYDCRRAFMLSTWVLTLDCFPVEIELRRPPVHAVTSIQYRDIGGALQTLSPAAYQLDLTSEPARVRTVDGGWWPHTNNSLNAVVVTFEAGYATANDVPSLAKEAIKVKVAEMYSGCQESDAYRQLVGRLQWGSSG